MDGNFSDNDIKSRDKINTAPSRSGGESKDGMPINACPSEKYKSILDDKTAAEYEEPAPQKIKIINELYDWIEVFVLSAAFVLLLFTFFMRLAIVDGGSMEKTLHNGEVLIISNLFYRAQNNDIVVFDSPDHTEPIVKRIIAIEGQTVDINFNTWEVTVDGTILDESYVNFTTSPMRQYDIKFPLTVPEGYIFVMGDNRNDSLDSRSSSIGLVDTRYILGSVKIRLLPLKKFGTVQ